MRGYPPIALGLSCLVRLPRGGGGLPWAGRLFLPGAGRRGPAAVLAARRDRVFTVGPPSPPSRNQIGFLYFPEFPVKEESPGFPCCCCAPVSCGLLHPPSQPHGTRLNLQPLQLAGCSASVYPSSREYHLHLCLRFICFQPPPHPFSLLVYVPGLVRLLLV